MDRTTTRYPVSTLCTEYCTHENMFTVTMSRDTLLDAADPSSRVVLQRRLPHSAHKAEASASLTLPYLCIPIHSITNEPSPRLNPHI